MTKEVRLMVGIPGSGKSTWIKKEVARLEEEGYTTAVISRDNIRQSLLKDGEDYFKRENAVFAQFVREINESMECGIDYVFVDATHISRQSRKKVLSRLKPDYHTTLAIEIIKVPVDLALARNAQRTGFARVPDSAIRSMAEDFKSPTIAEFMDNDFGFKKTVLHYINTED